MEVILEVNKERIKYIRMSLHQNAGQNHDTKSADTFAQNVAHFKYLGTTVTNPYLIQEEIKRRLNSNKA
jgi:hypothetical protein